MLAQVLILVLDQSALLVVVMAVLGRVVVQAQAVGQVVAEVEDILATQAFNPAVLVIHLLLHQAKATQVQPDCR